MNPQEHYAHGYQAPGSGVACHDPELVERAVHLAANPMLLADRHGRICWLNQAFTRLFGYMSGEVIGQTPRVLNSGQQSQAFYTGLWSTISQGGIWKGRVSNCDRDGRLLNLEMTVTPVCDDFGDVTHFFVVYHESPGPQQAPSAQQ